ncbi:MAG TPA: SNF2-related protein [Acidobacteriota bacterium]|nr:SNF2-related protein [Acidobacteriota bacterium]
MTPESLTPEDWLDQINSRLYSGRDLPLETAMKALESYPDDGELLEYAAFAALVEEKPDIALRFTKRVARYYEPLPTTLACQALALAQQGKWPLAQSLVEKLIASRLPYDLMFPNGLDPRWVERWMNAIVRWRPRVEPGRKPHDTIHAERAKSPPPRPTEAGVPGDAAAAATAVQPLPLFPAQIPIRFEMPDPKEYDLLEQCRAASPQDFLLRLDLAHASLLKSYDELLCLPRLHGVDHYWYQVETARKVLRQFRGRVLLADEVGLGKTIEAGMILKEYMLRGMARRVLILTPASLVEQWREEMETKFGIEFATSYDSLMQRDAPQFWALPRIIASIAAARRDPHCVLLSRQQFDLVIVDEAHHLKNRATKNYQVVDGLNKRFLLLLSATPVQNNLIEIYNLLTLLKPGIFKTEKEFRSIYMTPGKPRVPANREKLQSLMRDAMIRNTRALVDVRLPARHAATVKVDPSPEERECYDALSGLLRALPPDWKAQHHLALHHVLEAAGSSPRAGHTALGRFLKAEPPGAWSELLGRYTSLERGGKTETLLMLLERNPSEKKVVFVRFRETLHLVSDVCRSRGIPFAVFEGGMAGPEKDEAIESFRDAVPLLLSTESGGEGRNIQFCNTMINFDLPWNPQLIEQRIGRIHRIGQQREVFVFNLVMRNTVEEHILRILDEKINMFELVVGEIQSILGEIEEDRGFASLVFAAWIAETEEGRREAFDRLAEQLVAAKSEYQSAKALDDEIFGEEFEVI